MRVFILRNPTTSAKGALRAHGLEVAPNVFATQLTRIAANKLFAELLEKGGDSPDFQVKLVEEDNSPLGISVRGYGEKQPSTTVIDGIELKSRKKKPRQPPSFS